MFISPTLSAGYNHKWRFAFFCLDKEIFCLSESFELLFFPYLLIANRAFILPI